MLRCRASFFFFEMANSEKYVYLICCITDTPEIEASLEISYRQCIYCVDIKMSLKLR